MSNISISPSADISHKGQELSSVSSLTGKNFAVRMDKGLLFLQVDELINEVLLYPTASDKSQAVIDAEAVIQTQIGIIANAAIQGGYIS